MSLLPSPVALFDVHDVDAFVSTVVRKLCLALQAEDRVELEAEGLAILYGLASEWDGRGTFYGYASSLIDKRLLSAWLKMSGCSRQRVYDEAGEWTGERRWVKPTVSLDGEMARPGFSERNLRRLTDFQRVPVAA